jgi:NAD(P)H-nitrite reductase large subunit
VIGKKKGWTVTFGGNSGGRPRFADVLAEDIGKEEVIELIKKSLDYYRDNGKRRERTARFIERTGIEEMRKQLGIS